MNLTRLQRQAILSKQKTSLVLDDEPACELGESIVLAWSKESRFVGDEEGAVVVVPPQPLFSITITKKIRHRKGGWLLSFSIADRRESHRFLAPKAGYTTSPFNAMGIDRQQAMSAAHVEPEPVQGDEQTVITLDAHRKFAEHEKAERGEQLARESARRMNARLRDIAVAAARLGLDATPAFAKIEREIAELESQVRRAA